MPLHRDQAYNLLSKGQYETGTPIAFFNFGESRTFTLTDSVPSGSDAAEVDKHTVFSFEFGHGDFFTLPGKYNEVLKHGVPGGDGLRVSIVLRAVNKAWVDPSAGFWTLKGDKFNIGNLADKRGVPRHFVLQPDVLTNPLPPDHVPILDSNDKAELQPLFEEFGQRRWSHGSKSQFNSCTWAFVATRHNHTTWLATDSRTKPVGYGEFESFRAQLLGSETFSKLMKAFGNDIEKALGYLYTAFVHGVFSNKRRRISVEHLAHSTQEMMEIDLEDLDAVGSGLKLGGKDFKELVADPAAISFAAWCLRRSEIIASASQSRASTSGSLPPMTVDVAEPNTTPEESSDDEPAPKAKAKAKPRRQRMA